VTVVIIVGTIITGKVDLEEGIRAADAEDAAYLAAAHAAEVAATAKATTEGNGDES